MIVRGRKVLGHLGSIVEHYPEVLAENEKLKRENMYLKREVEALRRYQQAVDATREAEAKLEAFRRERDARLTLYRLHASETRH